jgi:hypothetical protein
VEDLDVKIQLLVGRERTVNESLRQTLELQAVFLAARPRKTLAQPVPTNQTK